MSPILENIVTSLLVFLGSIIGSFLGTLFTINSDQETLNNVKETLSKTLTLTKKSSIFSPIKNKKLRDFMQEIKEEI